MKNNFEKNNFFPEFISSKNVFNKKNKTEFLFKKYNIKYTFFKNSFNNFNKNIFGLNYYILKLNSDDFFKNLNNLYLDFNNEDNSSLVQFKSIELNSNFIGLFDFKNFNYYFNYNINILNFVEIYKILVILYINKLIIKYIYVGLNQKPIHIDLKKN